MRHVPAITALALSATLLVGCGGNSTDAYCSELKKDKQYFDSLDKGDLDKFDTALDKLHTLAGKAPDEIAADWKKLDKAIAGIQKTLQDAGVSFADFAKADSGSLDADKLKKLQAVAPRLQKLSGTDVKKSTDRIQKHAKKECKVDLS